MSKQLEKFLRSAGVPHKTIQETVGKQEKRRNRRMESAAPGVTEDHWKATRSAVAKAVNSLRDAQMTGNASRDEKMAVNRLETVLSFIEEDKYEQAIDHWNGLEDFEKKIVLNNASAKKAQYVKEFFGVSLSEMDVTLTTDDDGNTVMSKADDPEEQDAEQEDGFEDDEPEEDENDECVTCPHCGKSVEEDDFYEHMLKAHPEHMNRENSDDEDSFDEESENGEDQYDYDEDNYDKESRMSESSNKPLSEIAEPNVNQAAEPDEDEKEQEEYRSEETKAKVPQNVKKQLGDKIKEMRDKSKQYDHKDEQLSDFYASAAQAFEAIQNHIKEGDIDGIKRAQIELNSLMSPMIHQMPYDVYNYIVKGGKTPSLRDRFKEIKSDINKQ